MSEDKMRKVIVQAPKRLLKSKKKITENEFRNESHQNDTVKETKTNQIDDIFNTIKEKKKIAENEKNIPKKKGSIKKNIEEDLNLNHAKRKTTAEGLPIYNEAELNMGKGGNTAECPFDCWCCF